MIREFEGISPTIGKGCYIDPGALVMDNTVIEDQTMLDSGSLVPSGKTLESGFLYLGNPARRVRELTDREKDYLVYSVDYYPKLKQRYPLQSE